MSHLMQFFKTRRSHPDSVNLASREFKANPYPFYARLREEAPVYRKTMMSETGWLITRYDDVVLVLKDGRFAKDSLSAMTPAQVTARPWFRKAKVLETLRRSMLGLDPPDHTRLRALVSQAFTPRLMEQMRDRITLLTNGLLDPVQRHGRMDLIQDYALPLPTTIIAEMLGVPVQDRHKFHRWSKALMSPASLIGIVAVIPRVLRFLRYIRQFIRQRRADPQDDLVSALIRAEAAGDTLTDDEMVGMIALLLVAGHETTVNLIGNGVLALLEYPEQMQRLRDNPALIAPAVEELLRFCSPVQMATERYPREDVTIAGVTIPRGEMVFAVIGSANRDRRQFANPDQLDLTRDPNKHLSFGLGSHFCLGAALARLEGQVAITTLLSRTSDLRLAVAPAALRWRTGLLLRGVESLPVAYSS